MHGTQALRATTRIVPWLLIVGLLGVIATGQAAADHKPADRTSAAGSETEVMGPGTAVTLLSEDIRVSTTADLTLAVTAECSIITNVTTVGNDDQQAFGEVKVWVEIDGQHVPVSVSDADQGRVVFCNRTYRRKTTNFDDEDATIETFMETRAANGFNWMALNVGQAFDDPANGNNVVTVEVKAKLTETATNSATAEAVVGNRTLIITPTHAANDEEVS